MTTPLRNSVIRRATSPSLRSRPTTPGPARTARLWWRVTATKASGPSRKDKRGTKYQAPLPVHSSRNSQYPS
jgi:hypothetical protein